jgi:Trypsin-co-occurring domain 2
MPDALIGLADAIKALRQELAMAMEEGQEKSVRFELGPVEMEFLLQVTKDAGGSAGVKFWIVSLGGQAGISSGSTHRVKLALTPKDAFGESPLISDTEKTLSAAGNSEASDASDTEPGSDIRR